MTPEWCQVLDRAFSIMLGAPLDPSSAHEYAAFVCGLSSEQILDDELKLIEPTRVVDIWSPPRARERISLAESFFVFDQPPAAIQDACLRHEAGASISGFEMANATDSSDFTSWMRSRDSLCAHLASDGTLLGAMAAATCTTDPDNLPYTKEYVAEICGELSEVELASLFLAGDGWHQALWEIPQPELRFHLSCFSLAPNSVFGFSQVRKVDDRFWPVTARGGSFILGFEDALACSIGVFDVSNMASKRPTTRRPYGKAGHEQGRAPVSLFGSPISSRGHRDR